MSWVPTSNFKSWITANPWLYTLIFFSYISGQRTKFSSAAKLDPTFPAAAVPSFLWTAINTCYHIPQPLSPPPASCFWFKWENFKKILYFSQSRLNILFKVMIMYLFSPINYSARNIQTPNLLQCFDCLLIISLVGITFGLLFCWISPETKSF